MTLKEYLDVCGDDETIYHIGTTGASGFIFIGTRSEYNRDKEQIQENATAGIRTRLRKAQRNLEIVNETRVEAVQRVITACEQFLENYKPLDDREVAETFERISDIGMVVMIEGKEPGRWWFVEEYRTKNVVVDFSGAGADFDENGMATWNEYPNNKKKENQKNGDY